ncbi:MFS transporter [Bradyrhizobium iriomotense]|uniref:MFS transporter n=1 Tax=Bradyrhizobium iriomotense TaxID=441950 RepID=A0ABQ6B4J3_9BRAD|nr:MFS transporter [Bradyrhizobium iriomotense]GLR88751.1 MFS transporter [Bradyrhizobium iriomotense]
MAKVARRLIPLMILMFCINFLDRVNIGFAALQMNRDLGLTPADYGFAAGILFVFYAGAEIPSNLILERVGARIWLARIMITWGLIAAANAFVYDKHSLYVLRMLLGLAEAGFFPGIMLYLIRWFPEQERAGAITLFMIGNPISVIFGAPLSAALLSLDQFLGLAGWQWMFVVEGLPAVVLGVVALWWLTETPREATWLAPDEREWLTRQIEAEGRAKAHPKLAKWSDVFTNGPTWILSFSKFCVLLAFFGVTLWMPQIVKGMGNLSNTQAGLVTAIPYIFATIASIYVGKRSDRTGERGKHIAIPSIIGAVGFLVAGFSENPYVGLLGLCVALSGLWVANTVFWTLPARILSGASAAAGIALINSIGNLGGFAGPYLAGWVRTYSSGFALVLAILGGFLALSAVINFAVAYADDRRRERATPVYQGVSAGEERA